MNPKPRKTTKARPRKTVKAKRRKDIRAQTKQMVLLEAGYKCGNPTCRAVVTLQFHHIAWVRDGGGNDESNLLPLRGYCHDMHTHGTIPDESIRVWKAALASLNSANRGAADLLIHLSRMSRDIHFGRNAHYSAGDLLQLAALINAELISAEPTESSGGGMGMPPYTTFRVQLTTRGEDFVSAWQSGREHELGVALARTTDPRQEASS